jgi:spermidine synthase
MHLGSPVFQAATVRKNATALRKVFKHVAPLSLYIPLYGSLWCLAVASDSVNARSLALEVAAQRLRERKIGGLKYYNAELRPAMFTLPTFVRDLTAADASLRAPARLAA